MAAHLTPYDRIKIVAATCGVTVTKMSLDSGQKKHSFYSTRARSELSEHYITSIMKYAYEKKHLIVNYEWLKTGKGEILLPAIDPEMKYAYLLYNIVRPGRRPKTKHKKNNNKPDTNDKYETRGRPVKEDGLECVSVRIEPKTLLWYNQKAAITGHPRSHLMQTAINLYMQFCITNQQDPVSPTIKNIEQ